MIALNSPSAKVVATAETTAAITEATMAATMAATKVATVALPPQPLLPTEVMVVKAETEELLPPLQPPPPQPPPPTPVATVVDEDRTDLAGADSAAERGDSLLET